MSFIQKPERKKKINVNENNRFTLESKHQQIINDFDNRRKSIDKRKNRLDLLKQKYEKQKIKDYKIFNEICELEKDLNVNKINKEEFSYLTNTIDIINEYRNRHNNKNHKNISELHNAYMTIIDPNYISGYDSEKYIKKILKCNNCDSNSNIVDGICCDCGFCIDGDESYITTVPEFKDKERIDIKTPFHYKKSSYFEKIKLQFQAKIIPNIPSKDMDIIMEEMNRNRINSKNANYYVMRDLLKRLSKTVTGEKPKRFANYYKYIPYLLNRFQNIPSPSLSPELENELNKIFLKVESCFLEKIKGKPEFNYRSSILNSEYIMYKSLELLGGDEGLYDYLLPYFRLLKDKEKLEFLDSMWKVICEHYGWIFIPTPTNT